MPRSRMYFRRVNCCKYKAFDYTIFEKITEIYYVLSNMFLSATKATRIPEKKCVFFSFLYADGNAIHTGNDGRSDWFHFLFRNILK